VEILRPSFKVTWMKSRSNEASAMSRVKRTFALTQHYYGCTQIIVVEIRPRLINVAQGILMLAG
jgi:hypothetical protein